MTTINETVWRSVGSPGSVASPVNSRCQSSLLPVGSATSSRRLDSGNLTRSETQAELGAMFEDELDRTKQIADFIDKYGTNSFKDASVTAMRHIMPMLVMEAYGGQFASYARKVKGIWKQKPKDWPGDICFVDPNNKLKGQQSYGSSSAKPKKEVLMPMLLHLVAKYRDQQPSTNCFIDINAVTPRQVEDVIEEPACDWDPVDELMSRINRKMAFMKQSKLVDEGRLKILLNATAGLKLTCGAVTRDAGHSWIDIAHTIETVLDTIRKDGLQLVDQELWNKLKRLSPGYSDLMTCNAMVPVAAGDSGVHSGISRDCAGGVKQERNGSSDLMSVFNIEKRGDAGLALLAPLKVLNIEERQPTGFEIEPSSTNCDLAVMQLQGKQRVEPSVSWTPASSVADEDVVTDQIFKSIEPRHVQPSGMESELHPDGGGAIQLAAVDEYHDAKKIDVDEWFMTDGCLQGCNSEAILQELDPDILHILEDWENFSGEGDQLDLQTSVLSKPKNQELTGPSVQLLSSCNVEEMDLQPWPCPPSLSPMSTLSFSEEILTDNNSGNINIANGKQQSFEFSPVTSSISGTQGLPNNNAMWMLTGSNRQQLSTVDFTPLMLSARHDQPAAGPHAVPAPASRLQGKRAASLIPRTVEEMDEDDQQVDFSYLEPTSKKVCQNRLH